MKETLLTYWNTLRNDRLLFGQSILIVVLGIIYVIYVSLSLAPTELQIATRFTSFGGTQYYRNRWFYLLVFILFGLVTAVTHLGLMTKLANREMRPLAVAFGWLSVVVLGLLFFITYSVLGAAYLR